MTDVNHTENLVNYLNKIRESGKAKLCEYCLNSSIKIVIIHENGKFELDEPLCTEKIRSLHIFLTKMFPL